MPFLVIAACNPEAQPNAAAPLPTVAPTPLASVEPIRNSTKLEADTLESPLSKSSLYFAAPELGAHITTGDPRAYRVHVISDALGPEVVGLEIALDSGRARRVSVTEPTIALGELLSADAELTPGAHWLFAAPVLASGLVPRIYPGGPRTARARRFFIGKTGSDTAESNGAVWLRKPEGTYNGAKDSRAVVFDAFTFSGHGTQIDTPCTITLRSPTVSGQLQLGSPFVLRDVPSGTYEVVASAASARASVTRFTVNRELAGGS